MRNSNVLRYLFIALLSLLSLLSPLCCHRRHFSIVTSPPLDLGCQHCKANACYHSSSHSLSERPKDRRPSSLQPPEISSSRTSSSSSSLSGRLSSNFPNSNFRFPAAFPAAFIFELLSFSNRFPVTFQASNVQGDKQPAQ